MSKDSPATHDDLRDLKQDMHATIDSKFDTVVGLIKEQGDRQDKIIDRLLPKIETLQDHASKTQAYWKISGASLVIVGAAVLGLAFDRLSASPPSNQPQQSATQAGIRL